MKAESDPVLSRQFPYVAKIIQDETWLEGERRGCAVTADDPVVCDNVCAVVLRIGAQLRAHLTEQVAADRGDAPCGLSG